jgi:hypothetical protein
LSCSWQPPPLKLAEQNSAFTYGAVPYAPIKDLLGYLELDLENRELDDKDHWEEVYQVINEWLHTPNSNRSAGG